MNLSLPWVAFSQYFITARESKLRHQVIQTLVLFDKLSTAYKKATSSTFKLVTPFREIVEPLGWEVELAPAEVGQLEGILED